MKKIIATDNAPKAIGPYSQAVVYNGLAFLSGQIPLDPATNLMVDGDIVVQTERVLENLDRTIALLGGSVIVIGLPGDGQRGHGVFASQLPMARRPGSAFDLAPTLCALLGFPASDEMPGTALIGTGLRIPSYGSRITTMAPGKVDEEYYENLRSLGYIR